MTNYFRHLIGTGILMAMGSSAGQLHAFTENFTVPPVPSGIEAPAGTTAFLKGHAVGTQNYVCLPSATGFAWTFHGPQATLFFTFKVFNTEVKQQITTHFLSPNPEEAGLPRATWQSSLDTGKVWAKLVFPSSDPNFVAPGAIPWLLLEKAGTERGPGATGGDFLGQTTHIQRLNTTGGVAPSTGCSQASNVGRTAFVPYTADYFFYKATRR